MKQFFYILLALTLTFASCKKDEPLVKQEQTEEVVQEDIRIYGEWILLDAKMFVENLETGEKTSFDHFDGAKTVSSLRYGGSSLYDFETIEKDVTTWEFHQPDYVPGYGEFILNGNSDTPMGFYVTKSNWTIVEHPQAGIDDMQLGGSSRPLEAYVEDYDNNIVNFYVQTTYEAIDGYNCKYFTQLTMKKIKEL